MYCAERAPSDLLFNDVLVDAMDGRSIVLAICVFRSRIQRLLWVATLERADRQAPLEGSIIPELFVVSRGAGRDVEEETRRREPSWARTVPFSTQFRYIGKGIAYA